MGWLKAMKSYGKIVLLLIYLAEICFTQQFDFSGYILNFSIYQNLKTEFARSFNIDKNLFLILGRIRLRPEFKFQHESSIYLEYEISTFFHSAKLFFNPNEITLRRQLYKLKWNLINEQNIKAYHFVDRFYFRKDFDFGNLIIGRQRISWGTGRIWNPTDLFNPINPADFSKIEKDGADALTMKIYLGNFTDLHFVFNPSDKFKNNNFGFRLRSNLRKIDFSFMSGIFDKRAIAGFDFAGNFFNAGIRGEAIISADLKNLNSNFTKFVLGFDNQFTKGLYALIEYYFNGEGKTKKEEYEIERLIKGEILNLSKNYVYSSVIYNFNPILSLSLSANKNLNDKSGFISSLIHCSLSDNSELGLGVILFFGDSGDEYWYYSTSVFLKIQLFF
ncbi:hypothetical protein JGI3_00158 [Candidatus Kryptobacter tengchongensis]|nr:hypothetical protein JGI3_00158 [Candidatus Kryptobacter tengchongensis]